MIGFKTRHDDGKTLSIASVNAFSPSVPNSMLSGNLSSTASMSLSSSVFICSKKLLYVLYVASLCNKTGPKKLVGQEDLGYHAYFLYSLS